MTDDAQGTEVVKRENVDDLEVQEGRFDLADVEDPTAGLEQARKLVTYMADKCQGAEYIASIQGKKYPKVDWWTTVGGGLGLFPREESCEKLNRPGETAYEATVGVYNGDQLVTRASAICSSEERTWSGRDEYAIRSMAITRATGKAYRIGLSFLPVMAGLEPTPAEEMPNRGQDQGHTCIDLDEPLGFSKYADMTWREVAVEEPGFIRWLSEQPDQDRLCEDGLERLRDVIRQEQANGGAPSGESEAVGASAGDVPGESACKETVVAKLKEAWGDGWKGQLSEFGFKHPTLSASPQEWPEEAWADIQVGMEREGLAYFEDPASMAGEEVEA